MLQNAYLIAKIGADTAENEQHFAEKLPKMLAKFRENFLVQARPCRFAGAGGAASAEVHRAPVHDLHFRRHAPGRAGVLPGALARRA